MSKRGEQKEVDYLSIKQAKEIKQAFEMFDTNGTGKFDPKEIKAAMHLLEYNKEFPIIYQLISDLDTPKTEKNGGISFDEFAEAINDKLGDNESEEGKQRIFNLFIDDPNDNKITSSSLKKISKEVEEKMSDEEIKEFFERASSNGSSINFEEFMDIMSKKL